MKLKYFIELIARCVVKNVVPLCGDNVSDIFISPPFVNALDITSIDSLVLLLYM